jgi:hypothetical protein
LTYQIFLYLYIFKNFYRLILFIGFNRGLLKYIDILKILYFILILYWLRIIFKFNCKTCLIILTQLYAIIFNIYLLKFYFIFFISFSAIWTPIFILLFTHCTNRKKITLFCIWLIYIFILLVIFQKLYILCIFYILYSNFWYL